MMSSIVKLTHANISEGKDPKEEITKFLLMYRNTPHSSTGQSPASLMMERKIKTQDQVTNHRHCTANFSKAPAG